MKKKLKIYHVSLLVKLDELISADATAAVIPIESASMLLSATEDRLDLMTRRFRTMGIMYENRSALEIDRLRGQIQALQKQLAAH